MRLKAVPPTPCTHYYTNCCAPQARKKPAEAKRPAGVMKSDLRRSREQRDAARRTQATGERDERARDGRAPKALEGGESADGHGRQHWGGPPLPAQPPPLLHPLSLAALYFLGNKKRPLRAMSCGISTLYYRGGLMSKRVIRKRAAAAKAKSGYRI